MGATPGLDNSCGLLEKLSPEIRVLIIKDVYADVEFHIYRRGNAPALRSQYHYDQDNSHENAIAIAKTCRKLYEEAISVIYSTSKFSMMDLANLHIFIESLPDMAKLIVANVDVRHCWLTCATFWERPAEIPYALTHLPRLKNLNIQVGHLFRLDRLKTVVANLDTACNGRHREVAITADNGSLIVALQACCYPEHMARLIGELVDLELPEGFSVLITSVDRESAWLFELP